MRFTNEAQRLKLLEEKTTALVACRSSYLLAVACSSGNHCDKASSSACVKATLDAYRKAAEACEKATSAYDLGHALYRTKLSAGLAGCLRSGAT